MLAIGAVPALTSLCMLLPPIFAQSEPPQECPGSQVAAARQRDEGLALLQQGEITKAVALLKRAYELCPEDLERARDLAGAEVKAGEPAAAETLISGLLVQRNTAELHNLLGAIKAAEGDPKASATEYQIAAKMDPSEQNIFDFGTSLMKINYLAAGTVLAFGTKQFPNSVKLHVALGVALYAQDRAEDGAKVLCKAAALDPTDEHPMEVLSETEKIPSALLPTAVQHLTELHQRYPSNGLIVFDLTMARSGRWSGEQAATTPEFVAGLQQAVSLDPQLAKAHYRLAFAYRAAGDQQHFREEIERFKALHARQLTAK